MGIVPFSGFGYGNGTSFRIQIWEWGIFHGSDMGMVYIS